MWQSPPLGFLNAGDSSRSNGGLRRGDWVWLAWNESKSSPVCSRRSVNDAASAGLLRAWFLCCVVISIFAAYLSGRLLAPGTAFLQVFRVVGTVAFLGYGAAHAQESIWGGRSWIVTFKHLFDSLIFALLTAATFGWLWPKSL